jgi:hypothetical protein
MAKKVSRARELENAIADGYWLAKDHGRWFVGRGAGSETRVLTAIGYPSKEHARDRMLELHRGPASRPGPALLAQRFKLG